MLSLLLFSSFALAEKKLDLKPGWHPMEVQMDDSKLVKTEEGIVEIDGQKYRQIVYKNEVFYLRLLESGNMVSEDSAICQRQGQIYKSPKLLEAAVKVTKRTHFYMSALERRCGSKGMTTTLSPEIGVAFKSKDKKNDRKIYVNPLGPGEVGFKSTW